MTSLPRTIILHLILILIIPILAGEAYAASVVRARMLEAIKTEFASAITLSPYEAGHRLRLFMDEGFSILSEMTGDGRELDIDRLYKLESVQFRVAAIAAVYGEFIPAAAGYSGNIRAAVMGLAHLWPLEKGEVREALYRAVVGGRTAIEEAVIRNDEIIPPVFQLGDVRSATPSSFSKGVKVHSGDILLAGGGDKISLLQVRGCGLPGSFTRAAIVYVDPDSGIPTVIESIPVRGAVEASLDDFLKTASYRVLLLRMRPDHPAVMRDPMLPHTASSFILSSVREDSIAYDFSMDTGEIDRLFGSELVYRAYQGAGVGLWSAKCQRYLPGAVNWLKLLGITEMDMLVPSDLEMDPDLVPVAQWINTGALKEERYEMAAVDALLDGASMGDTIGYPLYRFPLAALFKGWSAAQAKMGREPTVPGEMGVLEFLRRSSLVDTVLPKLKEEIRVAAANFRRVDSHEPLYGDMYDIALKSLSYRKAGLSPYLKSLEAEAE